MTVLDAIQRTILDVINYFGCYDFWGLFGETILDAIFELYGCYFGGCSGGLFWMFFWEILWMLFRSALDAIQEAILGAIQGAILDPEM